jgi:hypothetical protein
MLLFCSIAIMSIIILQVENKNEPLQKQKNCKQSIHSVVTIRFIIKSQRRGRDV